MGQEKCVIVHKFLVRGSVEERVLRMQEGKRRLARKMLGDDMNGEKGEDGEGKLNTEELKRMLRDEI